MSLSSYILRRAVLPLLLKRDGRQSALRHWRGFAASQYWPRQRLLDFQWERLTALLNHAYETTAYYRRVFDERGLTPASIKTVEDLPKLPVLTRDDIREYRDELFSTKYPRDTLQEFATGGTTRRRMLLYRNHESNHIKMGAAWRFEGYMGRRPADKMSFFWPSHIDIDPHEPLRTRIKNRYLVRELMFYAGAPSDEVLENIYRRVCSFRPDYYKVFPNALYPFAEFVRKRAYRLPALKGIMSAGETLRGFHLKTFTDVFNAPTFNMYGSREVGNTACECELHDGLHISMETSLVEVTNNGRQLPDGAEGELIITDLTNYGFPMIRYAIEDFGARLTRTCPCGRTLDLMSPGVGRLLDQYIAPDGTRHSMLALSTTIAETGPDLGQIQSRQKSLQHFHLLVTNDPPVTEEIRAHIRDVYHRYIGPDIEVTIEPVEKLPREDSGKIRYFICEID